MTHRIDTLDEKAGRTLRFEGWLDAPALAEIERLAAAPVGRVRLVLLEGTGLDPACVARLVALPRVEIETDSPYVARLLEEERP